MFWVAQRGPGLPAFSKGVFDREIGYGAPPSFRLHAPLGSVAYEYVHPDLDVLPGAEYFVTARVRLDQVKHARAFLVAHYVDRFGEPIDASRRVSPLLRSDPLNPDVWYPVELRLPGEYPGAYSLRLTVALLQGSAWRDTSGADPVVTEDVRATAWFDDVRVYRLPRVVIGVRGQAPLVEAGSGPVLEAEIHNPTDRVLPAELVIERDGGSVVERRTIRVPAQVTTPQAVELNPLPVGVYRARLTLVDQETVLIERSIRFAVLNPLPRGRGLGGRLVVDIPAGPLADPRTLRRLIEGLGVGAVRVPIPLVSDLLSEQAREHFTTLSDLLRALNSRQIELIGLLRGNDTLYEPPHSLRTRDLLGSRTESEARLSPVLSRHIGGIIPSWQLGDEANENLDISWPESLLATVRSQLTRFTSLPRIVIPKRIAEGPVEAAAGGEGSSARRDPPLKVMPVSGSIATIELPGHLRFLRYERDADLWLSLEDPAEPMREPGARITDLARRLILTYALDPERVVLPSALARSRDSGMLAWEPTWDYVALRNLVHYLNGLRGVGVIALENDGIALIFDGGRAGSCVAFWTWRASSIRTPVELYLGDRPRVVSLDGSIEPVDVADGRAQLRLTPMPQLLIDVDGALAMLQASFEVKPRLVQVHDPTPLPAIQFTNHYQTELRGVIHIDSLPDGWQLPERSIEFALGPGETLREALGIQLPPRYLAGRQSLGIELELSAPVLTDLSFSAPLRVGLRDVEVEMDAWWDRGVLVVSQQVRNLSERTISFTGFCQAPQRAYREQAYLGIAPGSSVERAFVFDDATIAELAGATLHVGLREIGGDRELDQVIAVPELEATAAR